MADSQGSVSSGSSGQSQGGAPQGQVAQTSQSTTPSEKPQAKENGGQKVKGGQKQFSIPAENFVFGDEKQNAKPENARQKNQRAPQPQQRQEPEQRSETLSHDDLIRALEEDYSPRAQNAEISVDDQESDEQEQEADEGTDRQRKRIQNLSNRLREASTQVQQMQQYAAQRDQQMQQYLGGVQQQMQQMREQNARLSTHLEHLMRGQQAQKEHDPMDALAERLDPRVKQAIAPLQKELQALKQQQVQRERQAQTQQITQRLNHEADSAVEQVVCAGWSPEARQAMGHELGTLTMALAYGKNIAPMEAARMLKTLMGRGAVEELKSKAAAMKNKTAAARNIQPPTATVAGSANARGTAAPSYKAAREAGAKDSLEYMFKHDRGPI